MKWRAERRRKQMRDPVKRFESKFIKTATCWLWSAAMGTSGYGHFWLNGRPQPASQASYRLYVGEIPAGLFVLHECDNRMCVNPDHLFLGTNQENVADMVAKNRQAKGVEVAASKLSEEQVLSIRSDVRSQRKIGKDHGISHTQVGHIKAGKFWRHV